MYVISAIERSLHTRLSSSMSGGSAVEIAARVAAEQLGYSNIKDLQLQTIVGIASLVLMYFQYFPLDMGKVFVMAVCPGCLTRSAIPLSHL